MASAKRRTPATAEHLFALVWETIADVLGTAATATLVRRSAKRAAERCIELEALVIKREGFDYSYVVPNAWRQPDTDALTSLRELATELSPLLSELTGPVILRRLAAVDDLERNEIVFPERAA